jgi:hypothetical protein
MSENVLLDCPKCGQKFRIPAASGTVHVTCPKCREEWDWPRRGPFGKGATRRAAKNFFATLFGRSKSLRQNAFTLPRFTWAQLIVAWLGGIGVGILVAVLFHLQPKQTATPPVEPPPAPAVPTLSITNAAPVATNILNPPGINQKTDEAIPGSVQDLQPKKNR